MTSLWRNRDYMLLCSGQLVSLVGDRTSVFVFPLLMLALTGSPLQAGFLGLVGSLPYVFLSLPAGALVDRWDRRRVMMACDAGRAMALGSIPAAAAFGYLSPGLLYAVALVEGVLFVFFDLAQVAALPQVVGKENIAAASAQNNLIFTASYLTGPPLGGLLYQGFSRAAPFLVDAVSYGASVLSLSFIRVRFQEERAPSVATLRGDIRQGLAWLWGQPLLRFLAFLALGFNIVFFSPGYVLILIELSRGLHASPAAIGAIFAIGALGGVAGALLVTRVRKRFRFGHIMVACGWLLVLVYPLYLVAPNVVVLGIVMAALATIGTLYNIVQYSFRLERIPDQLQGRVNSVFRLVAFAGQPVGAAATGLALQRLGPRPTVLLITVCLVLMAVATTASTRVRTS
jgi:MFS family permease